jgi:hypothetical protein
MNLIGKITDYTLHTIEGTLTPIHEQLGYKEINPDNIEVDADGNRYPYYDELLDGVFTRALAYETEQLFAAKTEQATKLTEQHIYTPIKEYNETNGTEFGRGTLEAQAIHNCATYKDDTDYPHQPFCAKIVKFNSAVWKDARQAQIDIGNGTIPEPQTEEEFIALLPVWDTFNG